jgi:hypothetical protein
MAWINLTDANDSSVFVNMDNVLWFSASGKDGRAWLITMTHDRDAAHSLHVKQSPAEIVALLRSARQEVVDVPSQAALNNLPCSEVRRDTQTQA